MSSQLVTELLASYRELRNYLRGRLGNAEDAADIAQASFERVYRYALPVSGQAPVITSPRALLFKAAHNICINIARHDKLVMEWLHERSQLEMNASVPSTELLVSQQQLLNKLIDHLEKMPARRRNVFLLFRVYGYSREEIAAHLDITESAVAKHVVRSTLDCVAIFAEIHQALEDHDR
jgi:RNA polymerase sigma-70 factor (ECF subfamily)